MLKKKNDPIYLHIQGSDIVVFQKPHRFIYLQSSFNEISGLSLPDPQKVREKLEVSGFQGRDCILLTPRSQWLIDIDKQKLVSKKQLHLTASLLKNVLKDSIADSIMIEQIIDAPKNNEAAYICSGGLEESIYNNYADWIEKIGLQLKEIGIASFYIKNIVTKNPTLIFCGYPSGYNEVTFFVNNKVDNIYFSQGFTKDIYFAITTMILQHLGDITTENNETFDFVISEKQELSVDLIFDGTISYPVDEIIITWKAYLRELGLTLKLNRLEVEKTPVMGLGSWPSLALHAASLTSRRNQALCISHKSSPKANLTMITAILIFIISISLGGSLWEVRRQGKIINLEVLSSLHPIETIDKERSSLDKLEQHIQNGKLFIDNRSQALEAIYRLDETLSIQSRLERFYFQNGYIEITLLSPTLSKDLLAFELDESFTDVQLITAITNADVGDKRFERVGLRMKLVPDGTGDKQ